MTNDILDDFTTDSSSKATTGILVLSILTFIWNSIIILGIVIGGLMAANFSVAPMPGGAFIVFVLILAICTLNIVGAAKMIKLKKSGYWMYLVSNIVYIVFFTIAIFGISNAPSDGVNIDQLNSSIITIVILTISLIAMTILFSTYYKKFR